MASNLIDHLSNENLDESSSSFRFVEMSDGLAHYSSGEEAGDARSVQAAQNEEEEPLFNAPSFPFKSVSPEATQVWQQDNEAASPLPELPSVAELDAWHMVQEESDSEDLPTSDVTYEGDADVRSPFVKLGRRLYDIYKLGEAIPDPPAIEKGKRPTVDDENSPFKRWSLYSEFSLNIDKKDLSTWPPQYVILQDWHVWKVMDSGIPKATCHLYWPGDFNNNGMPYATRKQKGRAAKVQNNEVWRYVIVFGVGGNPTYQLHGDEGTRDLEVSPKESSATTDARWYAGARCLIQDDFAPSEEELLRGVKVSRYPKGRAPGHKVIPDKRRGAEGKTRAPKARTSKANNEDKQPNFKTNTPTGSVSNPLSTGQKRQKASLKATAKAALQTAANMSQNSSSSTGMKRKRIVESSEAGTSSPEADIVGDTIEVAQPKGAVQGSSQTKSPNARLPSSPIAAFSPPKSAILKSPADIKSRGKKSPRVEVPLPGLITQSSPSATAAAALSAITNESSQPQVRFRSRRAELEKTLRPSQASFWAAEAANLCQTMRDNATLVNRGLSSILNAITEACQAEDVEESERLLAAAMTRNNEIRLESKKLTVAAINSVTKRAGDNKVADLEAFKSCIAGYVKPNIAGGSVEEAIIVPPRREPEISKFKSSGASRTQRLPNPAITEAIARIRDSEKDSEV